MKATEIINKALANIIVDEDMPDDELLMLFPDGRSVRVVNIGEKENSCVNY